MITLQQLKYFRELANTGHLTQTAERLYITQTTLSNTIINLEKQLGLKLFDRVGRSLQLNDAGRLYLKYVDEALTALDDGQNALESYQAQSRHSVSVAMPSSGVWYDLIHGFHKRFSGYSLRQIECGRDQFRQLLLDHQIDFVIAGVDDLSLSGLDHHIIRTEQLLLCVPKDHPLVGREHIHLADAKDESFINLPEGNSFRSFCDSMFRKAGIEYHAELECTSALRGRLVEAGFGVCITTNASRKHNPLGDGVVYIPIIDSFAKRPIAIIWNARHNLSQASKDFRDYVIEIETEL